METIDRRTFAGAIASGVVMNSSALAGQEFEEKKMVWGMREPGSFGDYFPEGEFVGWDEQLIAYYQNEMPDAEKADLGMEESILLSKFANKFVQDRGPLKPQEQPSDYHTLRTHKNLASLMANGTPIVDEDLKHIIEALEPGMHQFWPIKLTMPRGKAYPKQYYGLRIGQFIESFSPELSDEGSWRVGGLNKDKFRAKFPKKEQMAGLAMRQSSINGAHLWRERKLKDPDFFFSDELHSAIVDAKLRVPPFFKLKGVLCG